MGQMDEKAKRDLPMLRQWVDKLLALANEMSVHVQYTEEDHLSFMALCFLSKQIDHLGSIVALIPSRDAILVARSMIEGLCQLLWAAQDPATRPWQWRAFAWVHDWRVMQEKMAHSEPVDPERRTAIEDALRQYGDQFLTKKAKAAQSRGAPLPRDPYYDNWRCGHQMRQICEAVRGEDLYQKVYEPFSAWHHWAVDGMGQAIERQGNRVVYSSLSPVDSASALAGGFQCLWQTVELTDRHLGMGQAAKLSALRNGLLHSISPTATHRDT